MKVKKIRCKLWIILFVVLIIAPCSASASNWTQFQLDLYNTGITGDKAPITSPDMNLSWDYLFPGGLSTASIDSQPLVVNDTLYAITTKGKLAAINKNTGVEKWSVSVGSVSFQLGSFAYGNGTIFIPSATGLYTVDCESKTPGWNRNVGDWLFTPITYDDHLIFFGDCNDWDGSEGKYYCFYDNGTKKWEYDSTTTGGYYWTGAAVIGDYLVFGDSEGLLTSVYKETGFKRDEINVQSVFGLSDIGEIKSSVSYNEDNQRLYFTSRKDIGGLLFSVGFNTDGTFDISEKYYADIEQSTSTPAFYNGRVYVGSGSSSVNGSLSCFRESDLEKIWEHTPNGGIKASPVISTAYDDGDGEVYIYFTTNAENGRAYCLRDYPGNTQPEEIWYFQPPSGKNQYILQGVTISDGWLYFGNDLGCLFGLATEESIRVAAFEASATSGMAPLTVQFNDTSKGATSWQWDINGDGTDDYFVSNFSHEYTVPGKYTVSINVTIPSGNDMLTLEDHIYVGDDWNPWNDPDSAGNPDGTYIDIFEVIDAYNCYRYNEPALTGVLVDIFDVIDMYNAYRFNEQM